MKTVTYNIVIDSISSVFGEYPGSVDVSFHREDPTRDGFENRRVCLSSKVINEDGSYNEEQIDLEVSQDIGETETIEFEEEVK